MNTKDAEFLKKLRSTFKIEAHEHLKTISLSLVELENQSKEDDKKSIVEIIHREFHSLKGAARAVSIKEIETLCHMLESIFSSIKKEKLTLNSQMFDIFNEAIDIIEDNLYLSEDETKDISAIMEELTKIESGNLVNKASVKTSNIDIKPKELEEQGEKIIRVSENKTEEIVRVSKAKLDSLLLQGEEMLYAKLSANERAKEIRTIQTLIYSWKKEHNFTYIDILEKNINQLLKLAENDAKTIEIMTDTFIEDIKNIMLLPFSFIIEMFPKMVRDLSKQIGKDIEFISSGLEIEIDRRILEEIKDPLMHIIRNCIDHGIENPEEREKVKKISKGTIALNITQVSSDSVKVEISDDGVGIDIAKLKEKAHKNKLLTQVEVNNINNEDAQMLIFKSGISTSDIITDISGRGLGLAIAYEKIKKLEGDINVKSESQKGTTFTIVLPITISTNRGIIVKAGEQVFAIPTGKVEKVTRIKKNEIKIVENRATILLDQNIIPIVELKDILEIVDKKLEHTDTGFVSVLVVNDMNRKIAFSVDEIIIEQEVLVKRFNKQLKGVRNIAGATILASGDVVPILDVEDLIKSSLKFRTKSLSYISDSKIDSVQEKSIIVVEDSITSRTLLKNILESQGYSVKTAVNGLEGWRLVKSEKFDLVITDVEMPLMDGFELTEKIRNDDTVSELPVILVTSLESTEDKEKGIDVGASAYIVKSDFQQSNLLDIIKRLI